MPELSVIIPTYQRRQMVCEAIDSVLGQDTGRAIEVIVVDDGSTDGTEAALEQYHDRIRYIRQANRGLSAARNTGIEAAGGEFIALLDSDDAWLPFKTELQLSLMERFPEAGFSFSNFYAWRGDDRAADGLSRWMTTDKAISDAARQTFSSMDLGLEEDHPSLVASLCDVYHLSLFQPVVLPSTVVVHREVLEASGPLPEDKRLYSDWGYFARMSRRFGALYIGAETALNRGHDDPVRLMRRDVMERAVHRLDTIRETWKADPEFHARFAPDVALAESRELRALVKHACFRGALRDAGEYLEELKAITHRAHPDLALLHVLMHVPGASRAVQWLRSRRHG
jgi:glycosyltransferase involved in cell wall biosynthesis